jgi:hypothetical protein
MSQVDSAARRILTDFAEVPGLQVNFWQAKRLWNLPDDLCDRALRTLMGAGYLVQAADGRYRRRYPERSTAAELPRPRSTVV